MPDQPRRQRPDVTSLRRTPGRPRTEVPARDLAELAEHGRRMETLEAELKAQRVAAAELAKKFHEAGLPKRVIAEALGITRVTLDAWLRQQAGER
jgi:hypothetical protein